MPIVIRPEVVEIRRREFLLEEKSPYEWAKEFVRGADFLPLYWGWLAALGLRPNGEVVSWEYETSEVQVVDCGSLERLALSQGAKLYPELKGAMPERPANAVKCESCAGRGYFQLAPHLICVCGGVGWTIPGEPRGSFPG